ncbi:hypothetical protein [Streptomyces sp. NPDC057002]|uniref:acyl-CoA-like ligand-binding transcription factor n=1 Tax=Streptomyces sp. NPDC057002 TaxID=3345992 RepID=UPI0036266CA9
MPRGRRCDDGDAGQEESCAEPVVTQGVVTLLSGLRGRPRQRSLENHLAAEPARLRHEKPPVDPADEALAMKMIRLADTEPALRTAWPMACDQTERELCVITGDRPARPADDVEARTHAAAAAAVVRVLEEHIGAASSPTPTSRSSPTWKPSPGVSPMPFARHRRSRRRSRRATRMDRPGG